MGSVAMNPVKGRLSTPAKIGESATRPPVGIADNEETSGGQTSVAKILPASPSRGREDRASIVAPIDDSKRPSKSGDEPESVLERTSEPDSVVVVNEWEHDVKGATSSSSPERKEGDGSPYLPRKREWEESSVNEETVETKDYKKMRFSLSREASPFDPSNILQFNFDTKVKNPYSFDDVYQYWELDVSKSKVIVDDLLGRGFLQGNDITSTFPGIPSPSLDWDECKTLNEVVAAPPRADDLYTRACEKLRAYKAQIDRGSDFKAQKIARDEMTEAWRSWNLKSMEFVGMGELRNYGEVLDAEGRESLANALGVQSDYLQEWIEGAPSSRKGWQTSALPPTSAPTRCTTPYLPHDADAPFVPPNPTPLSLPAGTLPHPNPASVLNPNLTLIQAQVRVRVPVHTQRRRRAAPPQTAITSQSPAPTPVPAPAVSTSQASTSTPATVPNQTSTPVSGQPAPASASTPTPTPALALAVTPASIPQLPTFTTPPPDKVAGKKEDANATGKLPSWAKDVLYTDSKADLTSWTNARKATLRHNFIGMSQVEEQRILGELYGPARADLTPQERRFSAEKRAYERNSAQSVANNRGYVLVCRASFALEDRTFNYRPSICGEAFSSHDIVLRHIKEQHLDKGRKGGKKGGNAAAPTTVDATTATSASTSAAIPPTSQTTPSNSTLLASSAPPSTAAIATGATTSTGPTMPNPPPNNNETSQ
ncbi:hypothetical protein FRC17_005121 [Serendipita sp. 399]|nr:hypothetical protein FRC17_005121 [Serendipita sp. 399]